MKAKHRLLLPLAAAGVLAAPVWSADTAPASQDKDDATAEGEYTPLLPSRATADSRWNASSRGQVQLGAGYTSDDNFMFGQYNGLSSEGASLIGNLRWRDSNSGDSWWRARVDDLGLATREGQFTWGKAGKLRLELGFDSQSQVRNDSGLTPFRGGDTLRLPGDWVGGADTAGWPGLDTALHRFDRELDRDKLSASISAALNAQWRVKAGFSYETKQGTGDIGGAFYSDASQGDAALLPLDIDYRSSEANIGLSYSGTRLFLDGALEYSGFDNGNDALTWDNPYDITAGPGALAQAPDNEQYRGRLSGQWIMSPEARLQFDGSYALASQDQDYLDWSANPGVAIVQDLPRNNYDGEVAIGTFNGKLLLRPLPKFEVEAFYRARDRDYDTPRDAYPYPRGDSADQPGQALAVYNTAYDYHSHTGGAELAYRLPLRSRLSFEYAFEVVRRDNTAVRETKEDSYTLGYRIQPWHNFTARLEGSFRNRNASTYRWDQRYYALLDTELINATPDSQRYINHPDFSQYYMANREQWEGKLDLGWQPAEDWNLNLGLSWRDDDYDASELGLTGSQWGRLHLSASWTPSKDLSLSAYGGADRFESDQNGRAFRGGQEKNAFEIYPPLPQASDPGRNWSLDATDTSLTLGANLRWQFAADLALEADYNYVDTQGEQDLAAAGAADLDPQDYPSVDTRLHHFTAAATWQMNRRLSLRLDYQFYQYDSNDWALRGLAVDSAGQLLSFGAQNPDETIHYLGASAIYRWE